MRRAAAADAPAMSAVLVASITELCVADHRNDVAILERWLHNKTPERVADMLAGSGADFFVAERNGEVAAVGCIRSDGEIGLNYVSPRHRLAGVSKALLVAMEAELKARKVGTAKLTSTGTAHRFYLGAGWQDAGPPEDHNGMLCQPMAKRLG